MARRATLKERRLARVRQRTRRARPDYVRPPDPRVGTSQSDRHAIRKKVVAFRARARQTINESGITAATVNELLNQNVDACDSKTQVQKVLRASFHHGEIYGDVTALDLDDLDNRPAFSS